VAFDRPTLAALVTRIRSDFRGRLSIAGPLVRRAMADVLAAVWAGAVHMLHGHLEWAAKQLFADTSDEEQFLRQSGMYGIDPTPATFAAGDGVATGANGSVIPTDTIVQLEEGITYRVTADAVIAGGVATVSLEAVLAGSAANAVPGATLIFESPIPGVVAQVSVASGGITGGFGQEEIDGTRDRLMLRFREPPEGGADQDYIAWALAVGGVTRAWVYRHELGLGTVVVRFVLDEEVSIFPDVTTVAAVQAALDVQRPTTAEVTAAAPTPLAVGFTIAITPDTSDLRAAAVAELTDLLFRVAEPGDGVGRGTVRLSQIRTAIGVAVAPEGDYDLTVPAADVVPGTGQMPILGTVTWL
jgi:uncharacterized phage protein gp47/JayE